MGCSASTESADEDGFPPDSSAQRVRDEERRKDEEEHARFVDVVVSTPAPEVPSALRSTSRSSPRGESSLDMDTSDSTGFIFKKNSAMVVSFRDDNDKDTSGDGTPDADKPS